MTKPTIKKETQETSEEEVPQEKPRKSLLRRLFRLLFSLVFIVVMTGIGLAALLTYYFPGEEIRPVAEEKLTQQLKTPVSIGGLSFNLLKGLQLDRVSLGGPHPFFEVKQIILDYDLSAVLDGQLTINQILVDEPRVDLVSKNGTWNFQPLLDLGKGGTKEPPAPKPPGEEMGGLPLAVNLDQFSIRNVSLDARIDDQMAAHLHGLTVNARARAGEKGIDLNLNLLMKNKKEEVQPNVSFFQKQEPAVNFRTRLATDVHVVTRDTGSVVLKGLVALAQTFTRVGRTLPSPDLHLRFDADADMKAQTAHINSLDFNVGKGGRLKMTAAARHLLGNPDFSVRIPEATFDLKELVDLAKSFLPPMTLSGQLDIQNLEVAGSLKNNKPETLRLPMGTVRLQNLKLTHAASKSAVNNLDLNLDLQDVRVKGTTPHHAEAKLSLSIGAGHAGDLAFTGLRQQLSVKGNGENLDQLQLTESTDLKEIRISIPQLGEKAFGVHLDTRINAVVSQGSVELLPTTLNLGDLMITELKGSIKQFGKGGIQVSQNARFDLEQLRKLIPDEIIEKQGLGPLTGTMSVDWNMDGALDEKRAGEWVPESLANQMGVKPVSAKKALKQYPPLTGNAGVQFKLENLAAELKGPQKLAVNGMNLAVALPLALDANRGVKVGATGISLSLDEAHAMEKYDARGVRVETTLQADQFLPLDGPKGPVTAVHKLLLEVAEATGTGPAFAASDLKVGTEARADIHSPADVKNIQLSGSFSSGALAALEQVGVSALNSRFSVQAADLNLEDSHAVLSAQVKNPSFKKDEMDVALEEVLLETDTRQNLKTGDVQIAKAQVALPGILNVDTKGTLGQWGQQFDIATTLAKVDLERVLALVPAQFKEAIEGMALNGKAALSLQAKGSKPDEDALKKLDFPVAVNSKLVLENVNVDWPDRGLKVEDFQLDTVLTLLDNNLGFSGGVHMAGLTKTDLEKPVTLKPEVEFDYRMTRWSEFNIVKHRVGLPGHEMEQTLTGRVEGLRKFLLGEQEKNLAQLVRTLDVALDNRVAVDLKAVAPLVPGLQADGILASTLKLNLLAGKKVDLNGEIHFNHLNVDHASGTKISDIDGEFLLNKTLLLERTLKKKGGAPFSAAQQGFFNQLREFSTYKNIFKIGTFQFGPHQATDIGMDVYYSGNRLFIDRFQMDLLGGGVAGNLFLTQTDKGPELKFSTEFAHIDFNKLLKKPVGASGRDVEIDGNMSFGFKVNQGGTNQRISLDQIATRLNITHIGKEALDRALLFIDPEESKPAIVDTRAKLKSASPEDLEVVVENGNLSMEIGLNLLGNTLSAPGLKRVPVTSLKQFQQINDQLQKLRDFQDALNYLSANGIEFDEEGNVIFF